MSKQMLINVVPGQECRIAIIEADRLEELYIERSSNASKVGNVYKGRVTNVESSIQAAFIDYGDDKNGFLHISDIHPQFFPGKKKASSEALGNKRPRRDRPPIQECLKRGQEIVVQMTKAGIGTKGPTMTTYISIPGRLLVMMPKMSRLGVSRKVEDPEARAKARQLLSELDLPEDMGFIVRTVGVGHPKRDLQRDLNYLKRLWKTVTDNVKKAKAPSELYQESDLVTRTIRDIYNSDIERIICDDPDVAEQVGDFLQMSAPRKKNSIEVYVGRGGLFHDFNLEKEIEKVYSRRVELKSGGSLIFDQAEALVAIDVNSGRFKKHNNAEMTATKTNLDAAEEIIRQLRLRDLGGQVVIDFIDMDEDRNRRSVERIMKEGLKKDRAKTKILRMSQFGIVQLTRQRVGPSLKHSIYRTCTHCDGLGVIKSEESLALLVLRNLQQATTNHDISNVEVTVTPEVAHHLSNFERRQIAEIEKRTATSIIVKSDWNLAGDDWDIVCKNTRGNVVSWQQITASNSEKIEIAVSIEKYKEKYALGVNDSNSTTDKNAVGKDATSDDNKPPKKRRRRGRRGGKKHNTDTTASQNTTDQKTPLPNDVTEKVTEKTGGEIKPNTETNTETAVKTEAKTNTEVSAEVKTDTTENDAKKIDAKPTKSRRRRGRRGGRKQATIANEQKSDVAAEVNHDTKNQQNVAEVSIPATQSQPDTTEIKSSKVENQPDVVAAVNHETQSQPDVAEVIVSEVSKTEDSPKPKPKAKPKAVRKKAVRKRVAKKKVAKKVKAVDAEAETDAEKTADAKPKAKRAKRKTKKAKKTVTKTKTPETPLQNP